MTTQKPQFDIDAALKGLREGKDLTGKDGVLTPLIKQLTEAAMQAELDSHLAQDDAPNRKNGSTSEDGQELTGQLRAGRHPVTGQAPLNRSWSRSTRPT
jgi:putative transposase